MCHARARLAKEAHLDEILHGEGGAPLPDGAVDEASDAAGDALVQAAGASDLVAGNDDESDDAGWALISRMTLEVTKDLGALRHRMVAFLHTCERELPHGLRPTRRTGGFIGENRRPQDEANAVLRDMRVRFSHEEQKRTSRMAAWHASSARVAKTLAIQNTDAETLEAPTQFWPLGYREPGGDEAPPQIIWIENRIAVPP